jgi:hypothetical protein
VIARGDKATSESGMNMIIIMFIGFEKSTWPIFAKLLKAPSNPEIAKYNAKDFLFVASSAPRPETLSNIEITYLKTFKVLFLKSTVPAPSKLTSINEYCLNI